MARTLYQEVPSGFNPSFTIVCRPGFGAAASSRKHTAECRFWLRILPPRSPVGAAAMLLITDTKANGWRGRDGPSVDIRPSRLPLQFSQLLAWLHILKPNELHHGNSDFQTKSLAGPVG